MEGGSVSHKKRFRSAMPLATVKDARTHMSLPSFFRIMVKI